MVSRKEARALGLKRYFTGKPCPKGHIAERMVSNWRCVRCLLDDKTEWGRANPDKISARGKRNYPKHREQKIANAAHWHAANPEKHRAASARYRDANPDKCRTASKISRAAQRARQSTPSWARKGAIKKEIDAFYRNCPPGMHVDHIVPLQGFTADDYPICGLHVPWNLQYLTPSANSAKGSRMNAA